MTMNANVETLYVSDCVQQQYILILIYFTKYIIMLGGENTIFMKVYYEYICLPDKRE